jgi:hypothetical protein
MRIHSTLVLAGLVAFAVPALAEPVTPRLSGVSPGGVRAGDVVGIEWSDVPAHVRELEILLSVDGGRHYTIRISPELAAEARGWSWRVPDLPTEHASVRLRFGRDHAEEIGPASSEFRIVSPSRARVPARASFPMTDARESGWWDEANPIPAEPGDAGLRGDTESLIPGLSPGLHPAPTRTPFSLSLTVAARHIRRPETLASKPEPARIPASASQYLPLRE